MYMTIPRKACSFQLNYLFNFSLFPCTCTSRQHLTSFYQTDFKLLGSEQHYTMRVISVPTDLYGTETRDM